MVTVLIKTNCLAHQWCYRINTSIQGAFQRSANINTPHQNNPILMQQKQEKIWAEIGFNTISNITETQMMSISGCHSAQIYPCKVIQLVPLIRFFIYKAKQHSTLGSKDVCDRSYLIKCYITFMFNFTNPLFWKLVFLNSRSFFVRIEAPLFNIHQDWQCRKSTITLKMMTWVFIEYSLWRRLNKTCLSFECWQIKW